MTAKREETIYKDDEVNARMLILSVKDGMVHLNEGDHVSACTMMNGGSSYDRDLYEIELSELMTVLEVRSQDDFFREMKKRFGPL